MSFLGESDLMNFEWSILNKWTIHQQIFFNELFYSFLFPSDNCFWQANSVQKQLMAFFVTYLISGEDISNVWTVTTA